MTDTDRDLRAELNETKEELAAAMEMLKQLTSPAIAIGTVARLLGPNKKAKIDTVLVALSNGVYELAVPKDVELKAGDLVRVNPKTSQIIDILPDSDALGNIARFVRRVDNRICEVETDGAVRTVIAPEGNFERDDQVVLDPSGHIIRKNLGKESERFKFQTETNITWDDIGGLSDAKTQVQELIELPHKHPKLWEKYGKRQPKGLLLHGAPGCGKTLIAKAIATSLREIHGKGGGTAMFHIKGPEVLSKWVGESESTIRMIFVRALEFKKRYGHPATVFIDEAESILSKRGSAISCDVNNTNVPAFLSEMDGLADSGAIVILATNRPDILDPAVIRDGRIDKKVHVGRPNEAESSEIFLIHLRRVPVCEGYKREDMAPKCANELFKDSRPLYRIKKKNGEFLTFGFSNLVSGAMIAGIVDVASSYALRRELSGNKPEGVSEEDINQAINTLYKQNRYMNHEDDVEDYTSSFKDQVSGVTKL